MNVPTMFARRGDTTTMPEKTKLQTKYMDASATAKMRSENKREIDEFAQSINSDISTVLRQGALMFRNGYLPVLGRIPCGPLEEAVAETPYHEIVPPMMRPRADLGDYLLEASGDSMSPRVESGDLVMLRPEIAPANGEICAVQIFRDKGDGAAEATLKRFFWEPGHREVKLKAINTEYEDIVADAELVHVVGVFRGLLRRES